MSWLCAAVVDHVGRQRTSTVHVLAEFACATQPHDETMQLAADKMADHVVRQRTTNLYAYITH